LFEGSYRAVLAYLQYARFKFPLLRSSTWLSPFLNKGYCIRHH